MSDDTRGRNSVQEVTRTSGRRSSLLKMTRDKRIEGACSKLLDQFHNELDQEIEFYRILLMGYLKCKTKSKSDKNSPINQSPDSDDKDTKNKAENVNTQEGNIIEKNPRSEAADKSGPDSSGRLIMVNESLLMVHWSTACRNDTIWELITCGFKAETYMKRAQDLCSSTETYNRERIVATFDACVRGFKYDSCSAEQKEGYVVDRFRDSLNAIPCGVTVTTGCVEYTMNCIIATAKKVAFQACNGLPCFCTHKDSLLSEFNTCVGASTADLNLSTCTVNSNTKTLLQDGIAKMRTALADKNCDAVDKSKCACSEKLYQCVYGSGEMEGGFKSFLANNWNLIEVAALNDKSREHLEETRAWRAYQRCRTEGYPDQYDRAVKCLEGMPSQCDVSFPSTVAFAEHFSNTTFHQTGAAAVKNVQQFCHVWCRNTTHWTGNMVNCLASFHPPSAEVKRENIISYILGQNQAQLKQICDAQKADPSKPLDKQLSCAATTIQRCYYLPYHLLIAGIYEFKHTLTASDAMEALHNILLACEIDIASWANSVIVAGMNASSNYDREPDRGLVGFFSEGNNRMSSLEVIFLSTAVTFVLTLLYQK